MSRRKRRAQALQLEKEILHQPVRTDGQHESPLIADYMQQFVGASHSETAELALALDRFLKGDFSLLSDPKQVERLNKFREFMAKRDDAERRWNEDREKSADDMFRRAEKVLPPREKRDEVIAQGVQTMQDALSLARANRSTKQLRLQWLIKNGPKRDVFVMGVPTNAGGQFVLAPEVINIMGIQMVLAPGKHMLPEVFAQRLDQMQQERKERAARERALSENLRADELGQRWSQIGDEFGSVSIGRDSENELLSIPGVVA